MKYCVYLVNYETLKCVSRPRSMESLLDVVEALSRSHVAVSDVVNIQIHVEED